VHAAAQTAERVAVMDLGSNSFRMVVFRERDGSWERERELARAVRLGEGLASSGRLADRAMGRGLRALEEFARACQAAGLRDGQVDAVATSAVRDADNGAEFLADACARTGLDVRVLTREQEARYACLAAVNSTTLARGCVLDLGGGSLQLVRVEGRLARQTGSWRLGAVRMTERFLPGDGPAEPEQLRALRAHVQRKLARATWLGRPASEDGAPGIGGRLVGLGGTVRSLAAAIQRAGGQAEQVHGFAISAGALDELVERLAGLPVAGRARVPGIKAVRADIVLAGALVIEGVMRAGRFQALEVTSASLREGIFFERQLDQHRVGDLLDWPRAA
jgi:exopolyphosphatase/guanosine-5'-triphosphate,3'-diphosphate pyrophosphatase